MSWVFARVVRVVRVVRAGYAHVYTHAWPVRGVCIPPPNLLSHPDHLSKIEGLDSVRLDLGGPGNIRFAVILLSFWVGLLSFSMGLYCLILYRCEKGLGIY